MWTTQSQLYKSALKSVFSFIHRIIRTDYGFVTRHKCKLSEF